MLKRKKPAYIRNDFLDEQSYTGVGVLSLLCIGAVIAFVLIAPAFIRKSSEAIDAENILGIASANSVLCAIVACAIGFPFSLAAVFALSKLRPGGISFVALLLLAPAGNITGQFLCAQNLGLIGTSWPVSIGTLFSPKVLFFALMCAIMIREKYGSNARFEDALPLALTSTLFIAAITYGDTIQSVTYIMRGDGFTLGMAIRERLMYGDTSEIGGAYMATMYAAIIPSLALGAGGAFLFSRFVRK